MKHQNVNNPKLKDLKYTESNIFFFGETESKHEWPKYLEIGLREKY